MRDCPPPFGARGGEEHCFPQQCKAASLILRAPGRGQPRPNPDRTKHLKDTNTQAIPRPCRSTTLKTAAIRVEVSPFCHRDDRVAIQSQFSYSCTVGLSAYAEATTWRLSTKRDGRCSQPPCDFWRFLLLPGVYPYRIFHGSPIGRLGRAPQWIRGSAVATQGGGRMRRGFAPDASARSTAKA